MSRRFSPECRPTCENRNGSKRPWKQKRLSKNSPRIVTCSSDWELSSVFSRPKGRKQRCPRSGLSLTSKVPEEPRSTSNGYPSPSSGHRLTGHRICRREKRKIFLFCFSLPSVLFRRWREGKEVQFAKQDSLSFAIYFSKDATGVDKSTCPNFRLFMLPKRTWILRNPAEIGKSAPNTRNWPLFIGKKTVPRKPPVFKDLLFFTRGCSAEWSIRWSLRDVKYKRFSFGIFLLSTILRRKANQSALFGWGPPLQLMVVLVLRLGQKIG